MAHDVFQIFRELELKAVGVDDKGKMSEGYFSAFRRIGLPIYGDDYRDAYSPLGIPKGATENEDSDPVDPKDSTSGTGSTKVPNQKAIGEVSRAITAFVNTFLLVDDKLVLDNSYRVHPGSSKVSDTWYSILRGAQILPSNSQLKPEFLAKVKEQQALLREYLPVYNEYFDKFDTLSTLRNRALAEAMSDPAKLAQWPAGDGSLFAKRLKKLNDEWFGLGYKQEVDQINAYLKSRGVDPLSTLISTARDRFDSSLIQIEGIGELPNILISPSSWCKKEVEDGWNSYTKYDWSQSYKYSTSSTSYSGGGAGGSFLGLWSAGGGFSGSDVVEHQSSEMKNLRIKFKYCIADIRRPWLNASLLNAGGWFLVGDYPVGSVSKGSMSQEWPDGREYAFLPSLTTSLILVKDVEIYWDNWRTEWNSHVSNTSASASAGFWCFTARANYNHRSEERDFQFDASGESLKISGIQLIGYVSAINPLSPRLNGADYLDK